LTDNVTPRSGEYGDVTTMYIRRSKILPCIYAKHKHRQVKEYRSTWQYTFQHKDYKVIIECDIFVRVHYITARYKSEVLQFVQQKGAHTLRRRSPSLQEDSGTEGARTSQPAPRNKLDLWWRAPLQSKLQNLNMQVQGSQKLPNK